VKWLRNPQRFIPQPLSAKFKKEKSTGYLRSPFFGFLLACKVAVIKFAKPVYAQLPILAA
jgi:hypothetical protein